MKISIRFQKIAKHFYILYYFIRTPSIIRKNPKRIRKIQNKKLKKIIKIAYKTELYRPKYDAAGIKPEDIKSLDDLCKIPILTKAEYRDYIAKKIKENPKRYEGWFKAYTSGSEGAPLEVWHSPFERAAMMTKSFRLYKNNGHNILKHTMLLLTHNIKLAYPLIQKFGLSKIYKASVLHEPPKLVDTLNTIKPDLLTANLSNIVDMIKYAEDNKVALFRPKLVMVISEVLTPQINEIMKAHFGDCIVDRYGCIETGLLAYTLKGDTDRYYFINEFNAFIVLNEQLQLTDNGNIYITSLFQREFPLINYQVGDNVETRVENGERIITKINGRSNDWIKYSDGTSVTYHHLHRVMSFIPYCAKFRVIQEDYANLVFVLVKRADVGLSNEDIESEILEAAKKILPDKGLKYNFKWVKDIPIEKNGKIRMLISKVK